MNLNPALVEINKLAVNGWELFDTGITDLAYSIEYTVVLKRKKS